MISFSLAHEDGLEETISATRKSIDGAEDLKKGAENLFREVSVFHQHSALFGSQPNEHVIADERGEEEINGRRVLFAQLSFGLGKKPAPPRGG